MCNQQHATCLIYFTINNLSIYIYFDLETIQAPLTLFCLPSLSLSLSFSFVAFRLSTPHPTPVFLSCSFSPLSFSLPVLLFASLFLYLSPFSISPPLRHSLSPTLVSKVRERQRFNSVKITPPRHHGPPVAGRIWSGSKRVVNFPW